MQIARASRATTARLAPTRKAFLKVMIVPGTIGQQQPRSVRCAANGPVNQAACQNRPRGSNHLSEFSFSQQGRVRPGTPSSAALIHASSCIKSGHTSERLTYGHDQDALKN